MANGAPENERLGHVFHFDRGLHARLHAELLERAFQRHAVDHRREHAHVIRGRAIHPAIGRRQSAPDISAADHHRNLHSQIVHFLDALRDLAHNRRRNVVAPAAFLQRLAAQFEHDAFVSGRFRFHSGDSEIKQNTLDL